MKSHAIKDLHYKWYLKVLSNYNHSYLPKGLCYFERSFRHHSHCKSLIILAVLAFIRLHVPIQEFLRDNFLLITYQLVWGKSVYRSTALYLWGDPRSRVFASDCRAFMTAAWSHDLAYYFKGRLRIYWRS